MCSFSDHQKQWIEVDRKQKELGELTEEIIKAEMEYYGWTREKVKEAYDRPSVLSGGCGGSNGWLLRDPIKSRKRSLELINSAEGLEFLQLREKYKNEAR